jgi:hypothetical protein
MNQDELIQTANRCHECWHFDKITQYYTDMCYECKRYYADMFVDDNAEKE